MEVAKTILAQLGGNRFLAMTGAHSLAADGQTLRMSLPRNHSKANRLFITLEADDTYTMWFFRFTAGRLTARGGITPDKVVDVEKVEHIFAEQLQDVFTRVTGMYTHL